MRQRNKECFNCKKQNKVLYRCKYGDLNYWEFLCASCLKKIKSLFKDTYQYSGTWKSKKK